MIFEFDEYYDKLNEFEIIEKAIKRKNASKEPKIIEERTVFDVQTSNVQQNQK